MDSINSQSVNNVQNKKSTIKDLLWEGIFFGILIVILCLVIYLIYTMGLLLYISFKPYSKFTNNEDLVNQLLEEKFTNKDQLTINDSYENKHLFEQKVYQMLSSENKKKYLDLPSATKDMFLTEVSLNKI